jgi:hypothetical protein
MDKEKLQELDARFKQRWSNPVDPEEQSHVIGRAIAHWAEYPPNETEEQRESAAAKWQEMLELICSYHNLAIVSLASLEEIEAAHK